MTHAMQEVEKLAKDLHTLDKMKRDDVVPYYLSLIGDPFSSEVRRINNMIIRKWSTSALIYIKEKARKRFYNLKQK